MKIRFAHKRKIVKVLRALKSIRKHWLKWTTLIFVIVAIFTLIFSPKISDAAQIGDFLAGFAGALAFLWLVASFRQQSEELAMQRKELSLQRSALELQTKELHNMGKYAALEQVNNMIQSGVSKLSEGPEGFNSVGSMVTSSLPSEEWKVILESENPQTVYDSYLLFMKKTGPTKQFITTIANASKFYLEATGNTYVDYSLPDIDFIYINKAWIEKIPHISENFHSTYAAVENLMLLERGLKSITLAGFVAMEKVTGINVMKEEAKEELYNYHSERNIEVPKIARQT